jgi:hypothetical protein
MFPRRCIVPVPGFLLAHIQKACYAVRAGDAWKETFLLFYPYLLTTGQTPPAGNGWRGLCVFYMKVAQAALQRGLDCI